MTSEIKKSTSITTSIVRVRTNTFEFTAPPSGDWSALIFLFPYTGGQPISGTLMTAQKSGNDIYVLTNGIGYTPTAITQSGHTVTVTIQDSTSFRGLAITFM